MPRRPSAHVEALRLIAEGRSDKVGAETITGAFFACVRIAREALGVCAHCREHLAGNRCRDCEQTHSSACCDCSACSCPCGVAAGLSEQAVG